MARDDDGKRVAAIGEADGANGGGVADALGQFAVGDGDAVRDLLQGFPDAALEGSAAERFTVDRELKPLEPRCAK